MVKALKNFWVEEDGQDMVEYSLLLAFIALGATALGSHDEGLHHRHLEQRKHSRLKPLAKQVHDRSSDRPSLARSTLVGQAGSLRADC